MKNRKAIFDFEITSKTVVTIGAFIILVLKESAVLM